MMYFDTHCHLNSEQLYSDYHSFIQNALDHEVGHMVVIGYDLNSSRIAVEIAKQYDYIYAAVGIGPNDCFNTTDDDLKIIEKYLQDKKVVALGEIGLDYYWDDVPKEKQIDIFIKQIQLAKKYQKPITIHCRDAYEDTYKILEQHGHYGIMHCYSGSYQMALRFIELGYYISLAGPVTFKNAKVPKEVAANIPLDKLLIETDSPYLTPHPYRGKLNEPAKLPYIAKEIASLRDISKAEVMKQTEINAFKAFNIE